LELNLFGLTFITDFAVENLNANQTIKPSSRLFQRNRLPHTLIWQHPRPCFYRGENQLIREITRVAINKWKTARSLYPLFPARPPSATTDGSGRPNPAAV
jgi:hypothetical protein